MSTLPDKKHGNATHHMSKTPIYRIWRAMVNRCENPNYKEFQNYGGRGICVSKSWRKFENFYKDMGHRPTGKTLDRINNNLGYSKKNCKWSTLKEQTRNKRNNIIYRGECSADACKRLGGASGLIRKRLNRGWSIKRSFTEKSKSKYGQTS